MQRAVVLVGLLVGSLAGSCSRSRPPRRLDADAVRISGDARMRTDVVGDGQFASTATFVLVDAENTAAEGAYVTLGGELTDGTGARVGRLNLQSLWIPAHELRTFALVDDKQTARPTAASAKIVITGTLVPDDPPRVEISELHSFDDRDKVVVQAFVVNRADRLGKIMVIGSFHDRQDKPMTRPFQMIVLAGGGRQVVQFVGPPGSTRGTIFVGDVVY
jgi:hypothetical protein